MEGFLLFDLFSAVPQGLELDLLKKKKKKVSIKGMIKWAVLNVLTWKDLQALTAKWTQKITEHLLHGLVF